MEKTTIPKYTVGQRIEGRITKITPNKIWLELSDGSSAFVPNYELPEGVVDRELYCVGEDLSFIVKHVGNVLQGAVISESNQIDRIDLYAGEVLDAAVVKHLDFGVVVSLKNVLPFSTVLLPQSQCSKAVGSRSARQMLSSYLPVFTELRIVLTHILPDGKLKGSILEETFREMGADEKKLKIKRPYECETFEQEPDEKDNEPVKESLVELIPLIDSSLFKREMDGFVMDEFSDAIDFDNENEEHLIPGPREEAQKNLPRTEREFELLVAQQPSSSYIYLEYAAFHLERAGLEAAFRVLERGLETIPETSAETLEEYINILVARAQIQLEFYGELIFEQKIRDTFSTIADPGAFCKELVAALDGNTVAEELIFEVFFNNKQRRTDFECEKLRLQHLYKTGHEQQAREEVPLIIKEVNLADGQSTRQFLSFIARLEYENGHVAEGRAAYEKLIESSKIDILIHYLDCEEKHGDIEYLRSLFKRLIEKDYGARKNKTMSILLKRWLEIEKRLGNQERIVEIRTLAAQMLQ